jgi:hypothetical protein
MTLIHGLQPLTSGSFSISGTGIGSGSGGALVGMPFVIPAYCLTVINFTRLESTQSKTFFVGGQPMIFPSVSPGSWIYPRAFYCMSPNAYSALFTWNAGAPSTTVWLIGTYAVYQSTTGIN